VKSTKHSSQSKYPRSFVFGKIYKFDTKLRDFHRNFSDIGQWVTYHIRSTFLRLNQLAVWFVGLRCCLWAQKVLGSSPTQARKEEHKTKNLPGDQKSETNFSLIQSGYNNRNFGSEYCAWFWVTKTSGFTKNIQNPTRSFGWAETGEILEVSGENKTLCMEVSSSKILPETSGFSNRNFIFPTRSFVFLDQSCSFCKEFFFVLPKLRELIPRFFATETSEYQIYTKFLTKLRLCGNRRNSRSFGRK
jgi:hypothetical protein